MKIKCGFEYRVKDRMNNDVFQISCYDERYYPIDKFFHEVKLIIYRVGKNESILETLKETEWFARSYDSTRSYIHYCDLSFMYHHNDNDITVCNTVFKV